MEQPDCPNHQGPNLEWRDGVPVSTRFDDPYFSLHDGLAETRHVFLLGNDLPARFAPGFRIAELGFGTGLNLLTTWAAWEATGATTPLHVTSFEAYPMPHADMQTALAHFPQIATHTNRFLDHWHDGMAELSLPTLTFRLITGDATTTLPSWQGQADAWFLDGFSPARNPALWAPALMHQVARHTAPGGTFATYSAAGHVRRALEAAGFAVTRAPGFAGKRHMSRGVLR